MDNYAAAFPDMHCELYNMYYNDDVVVVELSLNGTHTRETCRLPRASFRRFF